MNVDQVEFQTYSLIITKYEKPDWNEEIIGP